MSSKFYYETSRLSSHPFLFDLVYVLTARPSVGSGIHSRIELAMDLVKSHLTSAVKEEIVLLKTQIEKLNEKCSKLEQENQILKQYASIDTLALLENANRLLQTQQSQQNIILNTNSNPNGNNSITTTTAPFANTSQTNTLNSNGINNTSISTTINSPLSEIDDTTPSNESSQNTSNTPSSNEYTSQVFMHHTSINEETTNNIVIKKEDIVNLQG